LFRLAELIVTEAPLAVRLPLREELDPTVTLPKLRLVGDTANVPAAVPVPESATLSVELDAFDTTDRLPLAAPALVGAKVAVNVTLWFAVSVRGKVNPLTEKTAPVKFAWVMVIDDPPVLVSVSDKLVLLPTWILPNARLAGLGLRVPGATPVPERLSTTGLFVWSAVVAKVTLPLKLPVAVGANVIVAEVDDPGFSVSGRARVLIENPAPLSVADLMMRSVPPLFASVTVVV